MSKFTESFNADRLAYLIQNKERFAVRVYEQYYDPFLIPKKYLQKSSGGLIKVSYHQPGWGTQLWKILRFANSGIGLQGMAREIRHTISGEFYDDLDMVNAHPVILQHLCVKHKIIHDSLSDMSILSTGKSTSRTFWLKTRLQPARTLRRSSYL